MTLYFCSRPFGLMSNSLGSDSDFRQVGVATVQPNGLYVIQWGPTPGSGVVPVNPPTILGVGVDGAYTAQPAGQVGNGEQLALVGDKLVVRPNWFNGGPLIPNAPTVAFVIGCVVAP